ncbi:sialin-like [Euwallacea fornicatus]|uniref:sialin-like n=1 Tax=Euwallacea fornicatus TaxID=995702 RepID=UPI00338D5FB6
MTVNQNDLLKDGKVVLPSKWLFWKHRRYIVALMAFFGFFNAYTLRGNLSIAIVAMTSNGSKTLENGTIISTEPEFDWSSETRGYILSSFFYGYITTQLLGGYFAKKYGGKIIFGTGIFVTGALTVITPWLADANVYLLLAARIIEGVFEGVTYPSMLGIWSKWAPPLERTGLSMMSTAGSYFGTVITMPLSAMLAEAFGWRYIFYCFGSLAILWYALWLVIVASSPAQDSRISEAERQYIESSLEGLISKKDDEVTIPWTSIASSKAVWAICMSNFCENWGFYTFLTQLPTYLKDIYNFSLGTSGFLSGLPYLAMGFMVPISGQMADFCLSRGYLTVTKCRKIWNFLGFFAQACFLMAVAFVSGEIASVICLTFAVGIGGFAFAAYCVNPLDIAPQYASIILGISNTLGTVPGIISPILTGYIVSNEPSVEEWQIVFFIAAGLYLFGAFFYLTCSSGEVQQWAKQKGSN